jgi:phage portal protein BeeE
MVRFWPAKKNTEREMSLNVDEWASYFGFDNSVYPFNAFNGSGLGGPGGLYAFGAAVSETHNGPEEKPMVDFTSYVNGAYKASSPVFACMQARASLFTEARFTFQSFNGTRPGDLVPGDGLELLQTPWKGGVTSSLLARAIQDVDTAGNFYCVRRGTPGNESLYRLRPDWVMILLDGDPMLDAYVEILAYIYKPGNTQDAGLWEIFPADGSNGMVAHWAPIPDPETHYRGMSWITPIIREVMADKAIALHKVRYFQNGAKPSLVVSYDASVTPEQSAEFAEKFYATKTGIDNAYRPLFLGGGANVTSLGTSIEDFKEVSGIGELRIAAAARVPPTLVGLTEGMKGSALNQGNFQAAKDQFADGTIRPMWGSLCAVLEPLIDLPPNTRLWYDDRDVPFLRADQLSVAQRQQTDAATIASFVTAGFTPQSAVKALQENDYSFLEHTGLFSVQLIPPGEGHATDFAGDSPPLQGSTLPTVTTTKSPPNNNDSQSGESSTDD